MMYPYIKYPDETEVVFSNIYEEEGKEYIDVHISKGNPSSNSTKVWLTKAGGCILANNKSKIPENELNKLLNIISRHYFL